MMILRLSLTIVAFGFVAPSHAQSRRSNPDRIDPSSLTTLRKPTPSELAQLRSMQASDTMVPSNRRLKIIYEGSLEGNAIVKDNSRNSRIRLGGLNLNIGGTTKIPFTGSYRVEVTYDGTNVTGTERQTSATRGVSGSGSFRGTRAGETCDLVNDAGHRFTVHCTMSTFEYQDDYTNPQQQQVSSRYVAQRTAFVDLVEQERQEALAREEARKRAVAEQLAEARRAAIARAAPAPKTPSPTRSQATTGSGLPTGLDFKVVKDDEDSSGCLAFATRSGNSTYSASSFSPSGQDPGSPLDERVNVSTTRSTTAIYVKNVCGTIHHFEHAPTGGFFDNRFGIDLAPGDIFGYSCTSTSETHNGWGHGESSTCRAGEYYKSRR